MSITRPKPATDGHSPRARSLRCAACGKAISPRYDAVLMYGESFHDDCAFYRPRGRRDLRS
jgi:hypothetical protein